MPKSDAERQRESRENRRQQGLVRWECFLHPKDLKKVRALADELVAARSKKNLTA
jgi:hypothetical protein